MILTIVGRNYRKGKTDYSVFSTEDAAEDFIKKSKQGDWKDVKYIKFNARSRLDD